MHEEERAAISQASVQVSVRTANKLVRVYDCANYFSSCRNQGAGGESISSSALGKEVEALEADRMGRRAGGGRGPRPDMGVRGGTASE